MPIAFFYWLGDILNTRVSCGNVRWNCKVCHIMKSEIEEIHVSSWRTVYPIRIEHSCTPENQFNLRSRAAYWKPSSYCDWLNDLTKVCRCSIDRIRSLKDVTLLLKKYYNGFACVSNILVDSNLSCPTQCKITRFGI